MLKNIFKMLNQDSATPEYISKGALILDVRTIEEWDEGHDERAILIPLQELQQRVEELDKEKAIVAICRSGVRSGQAADYLRSLGYDAINGGPWDSIQDYK